MRKQRERREEGQGEKGDQETETERMRRRKMYFIIKKGSGYYGPCHIAHLSYLCRFLCSAVEDFVVDIVKAWSQIKQNNTAIESVILKVSFHSFYLVLLVEPGPFDLLSFNLLF